MEKLKTLRDYNRERLRYHWENTPDGNPCPNGISCPVCEKELVDTNPLTILPSFPPKKSVHCDSCDFKGYRVC